MRILLRKCYLAILFCFLGSLPASSAEITGFDIQFPYYGESYSVTATDGTFDAGPQLSEGSKNAVGVAFYGQPFATVYFGDFTFDAPYDAPLTPGLYSGATRYPFELPSTPGFDISFDSQGFDYLNGSFTILELVYGPGGGVEHFGASFVDYNNQGGVGLTGDVYYNYDAPAVPEPGTLGLAAFGSIGVLFFVALLSRFRRLSPVYSVSRRLP